MECLDGNGVVACATAVSIVIPLSFDRRGRGECVCVCVVLLLSVSFNNDVFDKIDSHDDCYHTKANIALRREYVVHVLCISGMFAVSHLLMSTSR